MHSIDVFCISVTGYDLGCVLLNRRSYNRSGDPSQLDLPSRAPSAGTQLNRRAGQRSLLASAMRLIAAAKAFAIVYSLADIRVVDLAPPQVSPPNRAAAGVPPVTARSFVDL
ncbi:hypothetical protein K7G98_17140 [Saccharothrix sp. MB29]|nr:hypothetical protein [Saccharothrix sp. MB29]